MVDAELLATLELLTADEQKALIPIAEYLKSRPGRGADAWLLSETLLEEGSGNQLNFSTPDEKLSPARLAARRFMRENPALMRLLAR